MLGPQIVVNLGHNRAFDYAGTADENTTALLTHALTEENIILSTTKPFQQMVYCL